MKLWVLIRTQTLSTTNKIILMYTQYPFFPQGTPYSVDTYLFVRPLYFFTQFHFKYMGIFRQKCE